LPVALDYHGEPPALKVKRNFGKLTIRLNVQGVMLENSGIERAFNACFVIAVEVGEKKDAFRWVAKGIKMLIEEDIVPARADKVVHFLAPILIAATAVLALGVIPYGRNMTPFSIDGGILFFFAVGSTTEVGLSANSPAMRIAGLTTWVVANPPPSFGGRYFIFLKLVTDDGIEGVGEVYAATFGPHTGARMIEDVCARHVVGADPFRIEALWRAVYSSGYSGRPDISLVGVLNDGREGYAVQVGGGLAHPGFEIAEHRLEIMSDADHVVGP